jgi:phosphohistidine phosphatase
MRTGTHVANPKASPVMRTLILLRHAKSSWDHPGLDDFVRPLNDRGRKAAPEMGAALKRLNLKPNLILCSPSRRTRETLDLVLPFLPLPPPDIRYPENLYLAGTRDLISQVQKITPEMNTAMIVGHNPGLHGLALALAGQGEAQNLSLLRQKFPTAALAVLTFAGDDWHQAGPAQGTLTAFLTPKRAA